MHRWMMEVFREIWCLFIVFVLIMVTWYGLVIQIGDFKVELYGIERHLEVWGNESLR